MKNNAVLVNRYAKAVVGLFAEKGNVSELLNDCQSISEIFNANTDVFSVLKSPSIAVEQKKEFISALFINKINVATLHFLQLLIDNRRVEVMADIIFEAQILAEKQLGIERAVIYTATDLSHEELQKIIDKMTKVSGKQINARNIVDPSVIGGFRAYVGDGLFDFSLKNKLENIRKHLT